MATARKRKRTPFKGRTQVALGLLLFIAVCVLVVWRRSLGVAAATEMRQLSLERRSLQSQRVTLERELREASKMNRVVQAAEKRLGLHVAGESQTRMLPDSVLQDRSLPR